MLDFDASGNVIEVPDPAGAAASAEPSVEPLRPPLAAAGPLPAPGYRVSLGYTVDLCAFGDWARYPDGRKMSEYDKNDRLQFTSLCALVAGEPAPRFFVRPEVLAQDAEGAFADAGGWAAELGRLLDGAGRICLFNAPFFFGVLQKYYPSQAPLTVWRHRTFDPFTVARCSTGVWVGLQHLLDRNPAAAKLAGLRWAPPAGRAADAYASGQFRAVRSGSWEGARVAGALFLAVQETGQLVFDKRCKRADRVGDSGDVEKTYTLRIKL